MSRFFTNLAVILVAAASVACAQQYKNVTAQEAKTMIDKGDIVVVDDGSTDNTNRILKNKTWQPRSL